ncbi:hypothetical protein AB4Z34_33435 [Ensifer sp. 2YAB10]|uniref:hypothetical protein n=1 Tax=unclassified Ensifer TaxID=2633371 RepID=UPI003F919E54
MAAKLLAIGIRLPDSKSRSVEGDTPAASARCGCVQFKSARAARHCAGVTVNLIKKQQCHRLVLTLGRCWCFLMTYRFFGNIATQGDRHERTRSRTGNCHQNSVTARARQKKTGLRIQDWADRFQRRPHGLCD